MAQTLVSLLVHGVIQIVAIRKKRDLDELSDILFRIKRGLAGYVSYLAACDMNQAFSEFVLYEPGSAGTIT